MKNKEVREAISNSLKTTLLFTAIESLALSVFFALSAGLFAAADMYGYTAFAMIAALNSAYQSIVRYKLYKDQ